MKMKRLQKLFFLLCLYGGMLEAASNYNYDIPDQVMANGHTWSCMDADSSTETNPTVCIDGLEDDDPTGVLQIPNTVAGKSGRIYTVTEVDIEEYNDNWQYVTGLKIPSTVLKLSLDIPQSQITSITLPSKLVYLYLDIPSLKSIVLPSGLKTLELYSDELSSLVLPDTLESFSWGCCPLVKSLHIPTSCIDLGFELSSLETITVATQNPEYSASNNVLYNKDKTSLYFIGAKHTTFIVPDSVKRLSLSDNCNVTTLTIGKNVNYIGKYFEKRMPKLTSVTVDPANEYFCMHDGCLYDIDLTTRYWGTPGSGSQIVKITFDASGGCFDPDGERKSTWPAWTSTNSGLPFGSLPVPARNFYKFDGWYTLASGGTRISNSTTVPSSDQTFYAHWSEDWTTSIGYSDVEPIEVDDGWAPSYTMYPVVLTPGDGTGSPLLTHVVTGNASVPANRFLRTGWTFSGWKVYDACRPGEEYSYMGIGGGYVGEYLAGSTLEFCGSTVLVAQWKANAQSVTVTFDANGGSIGSSPTTTQTVESGSTIDWLPVAWRTDYQFVGWYTSASGGRRIDESEIINSSVTYYARWTPGNKVELNLNGGSICCTPQVWYVASGSPVGDLPSTGTRSGYAFAGWWTTATGGEEITSETIVTRDITCYAHWVPIVFGSGEKWSYEPGNCWRSGRIDANGSTYASMAVTGPGSLSFEWKTSSESGCDKLHFLVNDSEQIPAISGETDWISESFKFTGSGNLTFKWKYTKDGSGDRGSDCGWIKNVVWTSTTMCTVTFNPNGGSVSPTTKPTESGSAVGTLPTPTKTGYSFDGWYTAASGGTKILESTTVNGNVTCHAHWTANTYTVTFNANGGSVSPTSKTVTYDSTYGELPSPERSGLVFDGWYTSASGGAKIVPSTKVSITSNQTLYAHWNQIAPVFTIENGTLTGVDLNGCSEVEIPYGVTSIGDSAFKGFRNITRVAIPSSVTNIGTSAFSGCSGLANIVIPDSVMNIGNCAFRGCSGLADDEGFVVVKRVLYDYVGSATEITVPNGVGSIGWSAFNNNDLIKRVTLPAGVESVGGMAFYDCQNLVELKIQDGLKTIGESAFERSQKLARVTLPPSIVSIGQFAFRNCYALTNLNIPNSVTSIGGGVFSGCRGLTSITISESLTSVGIALFEGCKGLADSEGFIVLGDVFCGYFGTASKVTIPAGVKVVGGGAFANCGSLTDVTIPDSVTNIGFSAFHSCSALASVTIPSSVSVINNLAFIYCRAMKSVAIPASVTSIGEWAFKDTALTSVHVSPGDAARIRKLLEGAGYVGSATFVEDLVYTITFNANGGSVSPVTRTVGQGATVGTLPTPSRNGYVYAGWWTAPDGGERIDASAIVSRDITYFAHWNQIDPKFTIENGILTGVDLNGCSDVEIPYGVTSIGDSAFKDCRGITSVTIPGSVTNIGRSAFSGCSGLTSITIPDSVTVIGPSAFSDCIRLESVTIPDSVTSIKWYAFYRCRGLTSVTIPNSVTNIGICAFDDCTGLVNVTLPDGITSIAGAMFYNCSALTSVTIPDSVTSIDYNAFSGCGSLASLRIPDGVTNIANDAFDGVPFYSNLPDGLIVLGKVAYRMKGVCPANVTIPDGVTSIGAYAFNNCGSLERVTIPNGVTHIGDHAFFGCRGLASVTIPNSVTNIAFCAFENCIGLVNVMLPDGVTNVGRNAFNNCRSLASVTLLPRTISLAEYAFAECKALKNVYASGELKGTFAKSVFPPAAKIAYGTVVQVYVEEGQANMGSVSGYGAYQPGKNAMLKATPGNGYVFVGWYDGGRGAAALPGDDVAYLSKSPSYSYPVPSDHAVIVARFAKGSDDAASLKVNVADVTTEKDGSISLDLGACVESLSLPKLAVSGLPSGVKYDAKTMKISGKATKPGVYTVKIAATNASVKKATPDSTREFRLIVPNLSSYAMPGLRPETDAYGVLSAGVAFDQALVDCAPASGWTVKVSGLPAGLKFAAKDIVDSKTKEVLAPANTIYGVPTKAGTFTVTFTATKNGETKQTATITLKVEALPAWATGVYNGAAFDGEGNTKGLVASLTIAANGKISGKLIDAAGTWTLSAASYSAVESPSLNVDDSVFCAAVIAKCGKLVTTNEVVVTSEEVAAQGASPYRRGVASCDEWTAWQNLWKTEPWKTMAKPFAKAPALTIDAGTLDARPYLGTMALKFAASGAVSASGKLVTGQNAKGKDVVYSASCSSVLIPIESNIYACYLYFPPKAGKFDGCSSVIDLHWNGTNFRNELEPPPTIAKFTVTFNPNGGSLGAASATRKVEDGKAVGALPGATREGYTFAGWFTAVSGGTQIDGSEKVTGNVTYYAHWTENAPPPPSTCTVTFNANGGSVSPSSRSVNHGSTIGSLPTPTRAGHTFAGWWTSSSGGIQIDGSATVTGNVTYYAHWTVNRYTATFDANGGSGGTTKTQDYGTSLAAPSVARTGYKFTGWSPSVPSTMPAANTTYVAQWSVNSYAVTFDATGGSVSPTSKSVTYDSTYGELPTPKWPGHTFDGWYTSADGGAMIESATKVSITASQTLYAHWTEDAHPDKTITWYVNGTTGNDSNDGTSESSAKATIQAAIDEAIDGDTILVAPGTYNERIELSNRIMLKSMSGAESTTIVGQTGYAVVRILESATDAVVDGFEITGGTGEPNPSSYGYDYYGGGVRCRTSATIRNCIIHGNGYGTPRVDSGTFGGGISSVDGSVLVENCSLYDNFAWACGGATFVESELGEMTLANCTIYGNDSTDFFGYQGGVGLANGGKVYMCNCIVWGNGGNQIDAYSSIYSSGTMVEVEYSCVQGGVVKNNVATLNVGSGNISAMPCFVDAANGDYRLAADSPCIDAGDNSYVTGDKDLVGNARIANGTVDIGCYEYGSADSGLYMVIDLSGGPSAASYPVSYLDAAPSGGWTDEYKTTKLVMRRIDPGTIPTRDVTLTKTYYCGVFEVTQRQYELVTGANPSYFNNATYYATRPVEQVSYDMIRGSSAGAGWPASSAVDSTSFIGRLRAKTGIDGFDLPTEAQWEYACRAGTTTDYNSGKNNTGITCANMAEVGRYWYNGGQDDSQNCDTSAGSAKVGSYIPNAWGLYDMHGNAWEWCLDWYGSSFSGTGPTSSSSGSYRVARGGGWYFVANCCTSSFRYYDYPSRGDYYSGFRLVRTLSGDVPADARDKVQLWEGGPYWATTNIGAENPEDYGYYFWWGDTVGYKFENDAWVASDGSSSYFTFSKVTIPTCGKDIAALLNEGWITADGMLASAHDAAQAHWGGEWRMPTTLEIEALLENCDWTLTTMNGVKGYIVRGRGDYVSNSIFLPYAGCVLGTSLHQGDTFGCYWSSVPDSKDDSACGLFFIVEPAQGTSGRNFGQSVRPVQGFTE